MRTRLNERDINRIVRKVIMEKPMPLEQAVYDDSEENESLKTLKEYLRDVIDVLNDCQTMEDCKSDEKGIRGFLSNNLPGLIEKLEIFQDNVSNSIGL
ncbi:MAG: hypothetical protein RLZ10_3041 [Bacteroidota bacterium]|jgi:hypothetical protein